MALYFLWSLLKSGTQDHLPYAYSALRSRKERLAAVSTRRKQQHNRRSVDDKSHLQADNLKSQQQEEEQRE